MRLCWILAISLATLFLVAQAAGSTSKPTLSSFEYSAKLARIVKADGKYMQKLDSVTTAKQGATMLVKLQGRLKAAVAMLDSFTPPVRVATLNQQLVKALSELRTELNPIVAELKAGKVLPALLSVPKLKGLTALKTVSSELSLAGYHVHFTLPTGG